jgi:hypothetical protein
MALPSLPALYEALRSTGVSERLASDAVNEIACGHRLSQLRAELDRLTWMLAISLGLTALLFVIVFVRSA